MPASVISNALPLTAQTQSLQQKKETEAAHQFEALLLQQWLKQARQSVGQNGLLDSDQTRFAQTWSDEQLAQQLATPGIGLAHALLEQMRGQGRLPAR